MRSALVALLFCAVLLGAGAYQTHLKEWPQVVAIVIACLPIAGYFMKQERAFRRTWLLLFTITVLAALVEGCSGLWGALFPNEGINIVDGQMRRVMTYGWVWPMFAAFLTTALVVWAYARFSGRPRRYELGFALAMLAVLCAVFLRYEL
ncbi:MAG: hypothetical protein JNL52_06885 [Flavobacteriales bacterium]|nr:hypothetical protein [Flavobacteriales bacterium]